MKTNVKVIPREELIIRESMKLAYCGGEIWFEQLDSLSVYKDIVIEKFTKDMEYMKRPSYPAFIAVNLCNTLVDLEIAELIIKGLTRIERVILKLVFVGLCKADKKLIKSLLKEHRHTFVYAFIDDYEKAKEWLILA